ncbi:hypothetical protein VB773_04040 [Haloarculaceae archaeon H-GB2-1]|nr:hypothetical protein [Haloarculaceae archaeon H-GB1-1]MEA5388773.1 hypothetical protein [Haloarculaceae archaeon H-GB11]MEA5406829.1 hypothetical protein [Haloarculaceae archaeon H-GB2-1]
MTDDSFAADLATSFVETFSIDAETAQNAAEGATAYREDAAEDLTVEDFVAAVEDAPYESFRHRFNWAIGDHASTNEDRPDTTSYRLEGFGPISGERAAQ